MEFLQEGIATLHDFGGADPAVDLDDVAVVIPVAGEDVTRPSVRRTLRIVATHEPGTVVIPLRGDRGASARMRGLVDDLPMDGTVLWCNAPGTERLLEDRSLDPVGSKGLDVWLGLALATDGHDVVAVHDADATSYGPRHLTRLVWPVANGHAFSKGYYARVEDDRLYGRLTRLLWAPLLRAIADEHDAPVLEYLGAFRYPLSGEFAATAELLRSIQVPQEFGLEVGVLGETYRVADRDAIAQVDLGWHRHDHRPVTGPDGLVAMARSIVGTIADVLATHGIDLDLERLRPAYRDTAERFIDRYAADAAFNGLEYARSGERDQVDRYAAALSEPSVPTWLPPIEATDVSVDELLGAGAVEVASTLDARGEAD